METTTPVSLFRFSPPPPLFLCFYRSISKTSFIFLSLCYLPQIPPQTTAPRKKRNGGALIFIFIYQGNQPALLGGGGALRHPPPPTQSQSPPLLSSSEPIVWHPSSKNGRPKPTNQPTPQTTAASLPSLPFFHSSVTTALVRC